MNKVFADTNYWVAITDPEDGDHASALRARDALGSVIIHTTDEVLTEYLNFFSSFGAALRSKAVEIVRGILDNSNIRVWQQSRSSFLQGLSLYEDRQDKEYSVVDCISMVVMRKHEIQDVLTHDHHFEQERFTVLIK